MKKFLLLLIFISGCTTNQVTHQECEYELVPDPSGAAKWRVTCREVLGEEEECGCWDELDLDPIGDKIESSIKAPKRPVFKGGKK